MKLLQVIIVLLGSAGTSLTYAQVPGLAKSAESAPAETARVEATPTPPPVISIEEITSQARLAESQTRLIRSIGRPTEEVRRIEGEFAEMAEPLRVLREDPDQVLPPNMSLTGIEDVANEWRTVQTKLDGYAKILTERTQVLESKLRELRSLYDLWERTRVSSAEPLPPTVVNRIESIMSSIHDTENVLRTHRDRLLTFSDLVVQDQVAVMELLEQIDQSQVSLRRQLFVSDSPPLWRLFDRSSPIVPIHKQALRAASIHIETLTNFIGSHFAQMLLHTLGIGILALFLWRRKSWWREHGAKGEALDRLINHPFSVATLIGVFLTRFLYPRAPQALFELNIAVGLVPSLRLFFPVIDSRLRRPVYALVLLYLVSTFRVLIDSRTLLFQLTLLTETVLSLAAFLSIGIQLRRGQVPRPAGYRALGPAVVIATIALGGAFLFDVMGKVALASLLTSATLATSVVGIALRGAKLILTETWVWLIRIFTARSIRKPGLDVDRIRERGILAISLFLYSVWAAVALTKFQLFGFFWKAVNSVFAASLKIRSFEMSLGELTGFIAVIWLSHLLARLIGFLLEDLVLPNLSLKRGVPRAISMSTKYAILFLGFLAALGAAGVEFSRFNVMAGAFGVGLAFGLQNIVNNFVSGLILLLERPIQIGDTVELGAINGKVQRIGVRSSTVRTWDGAEVIVPNADLISKEVINWTLSDRNRRVEIPIGVAYGSEPERVIEIIRNAAAGHSGVLKQPAPVVLFTALGESSLNFILRFWTNQFDTYLNVRSEVLLSVHAALMEEGIKIPFPQQEVHLLQKASAKL